MTTPGPDAASDAGPLAVICGGGSLPYVVARAAQEQGRRPILFGLRGSADPERMAEFEHHWVDPWKFSNFRRVTKSAACRDVVMIGGVVRPALRDVRLDFGTLRLLPKVVRAFRSGDDHLLSSMARILEEDGYRVIGAHEIAPEILMPHGVLSAVQPSDKDRSDIVRGLELLNAIGPFDVGQATVVCDGRVLAIEAAEGTDQMLAHLADLRGRGRVRARSGGGVLVKAPKPAQDRRLDLPAIGPTTVEGAIAAGLAGIAVIGQATIVAEPERLAKAADQAGLFVAGVNDDGTFR
jgi:UDP-2,3-diacylglucosamine hydrolase